MQKKMIEDHQQKKNISGSQKIEEKLFLMVIDESTDSYKNKKV